MSEQDDVLRQIKAAMAKWDALKQDIAYITLPDGEVIAVMTDENGDIPGEVLEAIARKQ
jgi:hypothetical protein